MDIIYIKDLKVDAIIGIHDWERRVRQTLHLDLELGTDTTVAAASRDVNDCLDYSAIAAAVTRDVEQAGSLLLETLAEDLAGMLQREFGVRWLRLQVGKPGAVANAADVGVIIERGSRRP